MPDVWLRFREVGYDAPFPGPELKAGPRGMPGLVPTTPDDPASAANRAAWERLAAWRKPFLVAFSDSDPITGAMLPILQRAIPGAAGIEHPVLTGAGHFLQEDAGDHPISRRQSCSLPPHGFYLSCWQRRQDRAIAQRRRLLARQGATPPRALMRNGLTMTGAARTAQRIVAPAQRR
jgi:hypothetical protein